MPGKEPVFATNGTLSHLVHRFRDVRINMHLPFIPLNEHDTSY